MSPVPTAMWMQDRDRPAQVKPFPSPDLFRSLAKEIVVDWQMPADSERKA